MKKIKRNKPIKKMVKMMKKAKSQSLIKEIKLKDHQIKRILQIIGKYQDMLSTNLQWSLYIFMMKFTMMRKEC